MRACARACVRACARVRVRACARVRLRASERASEPLRDPAWAYVHAHTLLNHDTNTTLVMMRIAIVICPSPRPAKCGARRCATPLAYTRHLHAHWHTILVFYYNVKPRRAFTLLLNLPGLRAAARCGYTSVASATYTLRDTLRNKIMHQVML